jgi:AhpD family alkylhydroperoxidase
VSFETSEEQHMSNRLQLEPGKFPDVYSAMLGLSSVVAAAGLEPALIGLVKVRASQINGCGYCIDMHTKEARHAGETEQRLYLLSAWREAPMYSARERAALAWTEAVTRLQDQHVPDEVYRQAREQFDEQQLVKLTLAVVAINGWNRFAIAFQTTPGSYKPGSLRHTTAG